MIDALIAGRLFGAPASRTSKTGKSFSTAKVRAPTRDGEALFVNVIAFDRAAVIALLALHDGDSVAISGELSIGIYTAKDGTTRPSLDVVAHVVTTEYHVARKRKAVRDADGDERAVHEADVMPEARGAYGR
jgi:single-stranded DNA-binding protein